MKHLAFLSISSSPSLKNIAQNLKPLVVAESPYFPWVMVFLSDYLQIISNLSRQAGMWEGEPLDAQETGRRGQYNTVSLAVT